jgi:hypothetical protein
MSGRDYVGKVKGERSLLERIMGYVPGYRGYKEKELRRESDRLVRMDVVKRLKAAKTAVRRSFTNPSAVQALSGDDSSKFDALTYRLDRITQRLDRAVAGYAGVFDAVKVREDKLDSVIQHDFTLIQKADALKTDCGNIAKTKPGTDDWRTAVDAVISKAEEFDELIDERSEIIRGLAG